MQNSKIGLVVLSLMVWNLVGCGSIQPYFNSSTTDLKSSTFAGLKTAALRTSGTSEGGNWFVTPNKITGKVVSVFFTINNTQDEGIVVYGYYRPDLAQDNASLLDFDLSKVTRLTGNISKKPGYKGGPSSQILMLYGYFDVYFNHGSTEEVIRFAYGTSDLYTRGDILLKNSSTGSFEWLNSTSNMFSSTRPSSPVKNSFVYSFTDPSHPDMKYFPLGAQVNPALNLTASLIENNNLTFTIDFDYLNALKFNSVSNEAAFLILSRADLVKKSDMKQNTNWENSGVTCSAEVLAAPR